MGKLILIIASTGHGKTTTAMKLMQASDNKRQFIYDYRGEPIYDNVSTDLNQDRCKMVAGKMDAFIEVAKRKPNTWLLVEEATIFFQGRTKDDMRELLVSKRHRGHNIILLFHTIGTVPPFLFDMADYIFLKKTGDDVNGVKRKRPQLLPYFNRLKRSPDKDATLIIKNT